MNIRLYSSVRSLYNNPQWLASKFINSNEPISSSVLNEILFNQNITVTDLNLKQLLKVKGVDLDLPVYTLEDKKLLGELTGKYKYKGFSGVYMFIHKSSG